MIYTEYEINLINKSKLEGYKEGRAEGENLATMKHIKTMNSKGFDPKSISDLLDIPIEEVLDKLSKINSISPQK